ncbi:hypothetical protein PROFUN_13822 [Planoprotostelium fungivorum]|uniref:ESCRT-II complex subunit VPS25 n=1 Tax=Planoprotostelium fungivorum TaxID=1890364 RepID=A0A2P6N2V3_9EUKA|nr:hypothetical protein PROFUN_13822 [Planoprotostelium fungivorum]
MTSFHFPAFYELPPTFTLQPVLNTRRKQLDMWAGLVLDYCKYHKKYSLDLEEELRSKDGLFHNPRIERILSIFDEIVSRGNGEWETKEKKRLTIHWRKPEEWASMIYRWVNDRGQTDAILTLYEIQQGDDSAGEEFHGLDTKVLIKALTCLEKQNRAQIFSGNNNEDLGVKFFSV